MTTLELLSQAVGITPKFTALIGTVQGDRHDIGRTLISMMSAGRISPWSISATT